ncbi:putative arsenate reductase; arsC-like protein [Magnetospirillum gryphiswaldense MSR-1 v2]|uniref:Arsenate reductase arsC-like protein n=1 Tax=Magnetospirillum gryphiswaldense (strain DSM 6361 / JCM 21280 / NBRC 15271 / MSR-1) TaxID=431944 RepID=V6F4X4_MAGGM|nr:arsenate reductase ArsC [Magnetospirillum gryphiswaldense]CDK99336.1 putative arsenate reductase; arsC-like protein [Magnetospirillum gryphiswaldense MSR-1 v2]
MTINVLVLCTGNSARSVLAECLINDLGGSAWKAYSAGSKPTGVVNPLSIEVLREKGHAVDGLRSKSWDEFALPDAPQMNLVITVCDNAAGEVCPIWPGHPSKVHVGFPDPAAAEGSHEEKLTVFRQVYDMIKAKIERLIALGPDRAAEV